MAFYVTLALINVSCFLPLYVLNVRTSWNPFRMLPAAGEMEGRWLLKVLYIRPSSTDPLRIHFDFTFVALCAVAAGATGPLVRLAASMVLALGFVEIVYTTVMHSIFKRPPALASDLSLLRTGIGLARRQVYWMAPLAMLALILVWIASAAAVNTLFSQDPGSSWLVVGLAGVILPPGLYHCTRHYGWYLWRTVYSPTLHFVLNVRIGRLVSRLASREVDFFENLNEFGRVKLSRTPNVVIVCIESYGSIVYRNGARESSVSDLVRSHQHAIARAGYRCASTFSDAPLFAGGSWLSYASFAYGTAIDRVQVYDALFSRASNFGAYESLFHVLRRNGYRNTLLCPLGGVDTHTVDWDSIDRCFRPHVKIGFDDLAYVGPTVNFFGAVRLHSALDQFALNFGYEQAKAHGQPFSLFFCTLNSHYPWHSSGEAVEDWRTLNSPNVVLPDRPDASMATRYNAAIRYQLDYVLRFAVDRADDAPLIILFGDHQPPMITPERFGRQTPIHVISQDQALIDVFLSHGFLPQLDLAGGTPHPMRHEGALSLIMKAMNAAYGSEPELEVPYREKGSRLFGEAAVA